MKRPFVDSALLGAPLSLGDLSRATGIPERRLRYYIEVGAVSPAIGRTRAAHYNSSHVRQVLAVVKALKDSRPITGLANRKGQEGPDTGAGLAPDWPAARMTANYRLTEHLSLVAEPALDAREKRLLKVLRAAARDFLMTKHGDSHGIRASAKR